MYQGIAVLSDTGYSIGDDTDQKSIERYGGDLCLTEVWEGTEAQNGIASLNHYSKGACVAWLFSTMCGIQVAGENHFVIAPRPGGSLTFAQVEYESIYGRVSSRWERQGQQIIYTISVPANTTADIRLPGQAAVSVDAGTYTMGDSLKGMSREP